MLGIELTALSAPEVKRLLELARARGQDGLARQLEAELAARPGRTGGQPLPMSALPRPAPRRSADPPPTRRRGPLALVAVLSAFIGAAVAWGLTLSPPAPRPQPVALNKARAAPRIAVALTHTALPEEAAEQPIREPAAPGLTAALPPETTREPSRNACLDLPTAHERLVCGYPSLAILDRRMKAALDRARAEGSDVRAIEDAQADWQDGSTNIQDRAVLRERYARRIAELEDR